MATPDEHPFAELPAALVEEVLERTREISGAVSLSLQEMQSQRIARREQLERAKLLKREADLPYTPIPTTCGVDGAFAIERMLSTDLIAAAAVGIEGLTPPSDTRYWPDPHHQVYFATEAHDADSGSVARAIMMGMELLQAAQAPHDVVFIDGSLTTPLIYFNQALNKFAELPQLHVSEHLLQHVKDFLRSYQTILKSQRSDKSWVAVPKYTTRREIGRQMHWPESYDDRAMLTGILQPGEFTGPTALQPPDQPWHLNTNPIDAGNSREAQELAQYITHRLAEVHVVYYRPYPGVPALRLEMSPAVAETPGRLAKVIQAVRHQCSTAAMMEPYPLYMADRMVKSLSRAMPTFRQVTSQQMAEVYPGDITDVFFSLHSYRTEVGR